MKPKIFKILPFFLLSLFAVQAQNNDPHGNNESAVTGMPSKKNNIQNFEIKEHIKTTNKTMKVWTQDEAEVKGTIEKFLVVAGNYNFDAMARMMMKNTNVGITRLRNGKWTTETMLFTDHYEAVKNKENLPYYEPLSNVTIHINNRQLAFVKGDGMLHRFGVPLLNNIDYFTLLKKNGEWKFINISFTSTRIPDTKKIYDPIVFAKSYAQSWCGQNPEYVAMFYTENGSLKINDGTPAVGKTAITQSAKAFMDAFPDDMIVAFNKLVKTPKGIEFHWTLTGTNTGPGGTGKKVNISGYELWQLDENGLIKESIGSFDEAEYNRQLRDGAVD